MEKYINILKHNMLFSQFSYQCGRMLIITDGSHFQTINDQQETSAIAVL